MLTTLLATATNTGVYDPFVGFMLDNTFYSVDPSRAGHDPLLLRDWEGTWLLRAWDVTGRMLYRPFEFAFSGDNLVIVIDGPFQLFDGCGEPLCGIAYTMTDRRILNRLRAKDLLK